MEYVGDALYALLIVGCLTFAIVNYRNFKKKFEIRTPPVDLEAARELARTTPPELRRKSCGPRQHKFQRVDHEEMDHLTLHMTLTRAHSATFRAFEVTGAVLETVMNPFRRTNDGRPVANSYFQCVNCGARKVHLTGQSLNVDYGWLEVPSPWVWSDDEGRHEPKLVVAYKRYCLPANTDSMTVEPDGEVRFTYRAGPASPPERITP